jgi:hypothetical protein
MTTATIGDSVFDAALNKIKNDCENLYITNAQATTFAQASSTYKIGVKATPSWTGPADHTSGRKITMTAITDGTVSATDTAVAFAFTDDSASDLLATQMLNASQAVTNGNVFTLTACIIAIPDPTA